MTLVLAIFKAPKKYHEITIHDFVTMLFKKNIAKHAEHPAPVLRFSTLGRIHTTEGLG